MPVVEVWYSPTPIPPNYRITAQGLAKRAGLLDASKCHQRIHHSNEETAQLVAECDLEIDFAEMSGDQCMSLIEDQRGLALQ